MKAYKYRLFPNEEQRVLIEKHFGCTRFVYNFMLNKRIETYEKEKQTISRNNLIKLIPSLKSNEETSWLSEVNSQSLQSSVINLDVAYTSFFKQKNGFPKFKSKHVSNQSYQIPQFTKVDFETKTIQVPKIKNLKFDAHRKFEGEVRTCTISRTPTNKYYISILVEDGQVLPTKVPMDEDTTIGIDLGLNHFLTTSRGEKISNPHFLKNKLKALKRSQRNLSRKKEGSNNRKKAKLILARKHEKVANERRDFHHKVSTALVRDNQTNTLVMEKLDINSMTDRKLRKWKREHNIDCLNKKGSASVYDVGWGNFVAMIKYKCDWYGKNFIQIGQYEPSSKLCSCGKINHQLKLSDREWTCVTCGTSHDRDILASNNIKKIGLGQPEFRLVEGEVTFPVKQEAHHLYWECSSHSVVAIF